MAQKKTVALLFMASLLVTLGIACFEVKADAMWNGWHVASNGGIYTETDGVITFSGDEYIAGPSLIREFEPPQDDFEVSLDLKAETLGEVSRDPMGAGEGFSFGFTANYAQPQPGIHFEMRARAGGQFLLVWHDDLCDMYDWGCNWEPFVYNSLSYNDGYAYWHTNPPVDRSNSKVKPDVWYTLKLKVQKEPFTVTGEVYTQEGNLLGSYTVDSINNLEFADIKYFIITSWAGGTFYIRNITGITPKVPTSLNISTDSAANQVGSPVNIQGKLCDQTGNPIVDEPIVLSYTFAGADAWYPIGSAITNQNGAYSIQWINTASGAVTLNAQWKGNSTHTSANAITTLNFLPLTDTNMFFVESNSTITALAFNSSLYELSFNVSGDSGTSGYTKVFIAKTLLSDAQNLKVQLDGKQLTYQLSETDDSWILSFTYNHSTHQVSVYLPQTQTVSTVEPANPSSTSNMPEWIVATVAVAILLMVGLLLVGLKKQL
jgi:hypothetical protein